MIFESRHWCLLPRTLQRIMVWLWTILELVVNKEVQVVKIKIKKIINNLEQETVTVKLKIKQLLLLEWDDVIQLKENLILTSINYDLIIVWNKKIEGFTSYQHPKRTLQVVMQLLVLPHLLINSGLQFQVQVEVQGEFEKIWKNWILSFFLIYNYIDVKLKKYEKWFFSNLRWISLTVSLIFIFWFFLFMYDMQMQL